MGRVPRRFAAPHVLEPDNQEDHHYYHYFRPEREFFMPLWLESRLGKPLVFALNNAWAKYVQVDRT